MLSRTHRSRLAACNLDHCLAWCCVAERGGRYADDDLFVIKYASKHGCSIVTNDNFINHIEKAKAGGSGVMDAERAVLNVSRIVKYMFVAEEFIPLL